jgi:hypothetical protein
MFFNVNEKDLNQKSQNVLTNYRSKTIFIPIKNSPYLKAIFICGEGGIRKGRGPTTVIV